MDKVAIRFWGMWGLSLLVVLVVAACAVIAVWLSPTQYSRQIESSALVLAAIMMGWSAWQSRSIAYSSREQIEQMRQQRVEVVRPSLSLRPEHYTAGGGFMTLLLQNTGGLAREVKIDIEATNSLEKKSLFIPAIDTEHIVYLPIDIHKIERSSGTVKVKAYLKDSYNRNLTEELSIDFGMLRAEDRDFAFQEAPMYRALGNIERKLGEIERSLRQIEGDFKPIGRR
ncbi:hypothetical protein ES706_02318 [subsurface metagenome]|nr:hypothetical protein [Dehalococcoidia bacterium]